MAATLRHRHDGALVLAHLLQATLDGIVATAIDGPTREAKSIHTLVQEQLEEEDENEDDEDPDPASWGHQIQGFTEDYHHRIVMHPSAPWRVNWDIFMLGMIVYVMLVAPFELTFISERMYKNNSNITLFVINRFVDFLFVVDFVMQFLTAYVDEKGQWVKHLLFDEQGRVEEVHYM